MTRRRAIQGSETDGTGRGVVLAVTADDDRYARSRRVAMDIAARDGAHLILYDWDSATILGDPLPTEWSADGTDENVPSQLDRAALEAAGRAAIAEQLAEAESLGISSAAWLPSDPGPDALAAYASTQGADVVVVPEELRPARSLERLAVGPSDPVRTVRDGTRSRIVVVPAPAER